MVAWGHGEWPSEKPTEEESQFDFPGELLLSKAFK
jgi:hypothetical protein